MALIRECQPASLDEWQDWYFENAYTASKDPTKVTLQSLTELGERLYNKIHEFVIPEWQEAFQQLTLQDCIDYVYNVTINRTYDGYMREKSVVNDGLAKKFKEVVFEESDPELDHAGDIDYIAKVGKYQFGIQIKPVTANANFGGYSLSERMKASFNDFTEKYGGKVFIVYSLKGEISNKEVIDEIERHVDLIGNVYANDEKLQNVSEYLNRFTPEAREKLIQLYKQDEMSLLPQAPCTLINDEKPQLIAFCVICSFVLILFCQITERLRGMILMTASTKTGRKIFQRQMLASLVCGGIIGIFVSVVYGIMLYMKNVYIFADCPISSDIFHFWVDMTFGQYLILHSLILVFISAISGLLAYFIGRLSTNYIAGIALSIPTAILYCMGCAKFMKFILRIDINPEYFYCKSLSASLLWTFGGLALIALLIEIMVYFLLKRDKERDIL